MGKPRKYQPLVDYLTTQPAAIVTVTFAEVEALIGAPLPATARQRPWWYSDGPHVRMLRAAGWRMSDGDTVRRVVTFVRVLPAADSRA